MGRIRSHFVSSYLWRYFPMIRPFATDPRAEVIYRLLTVVRHVSPRVSTHRPLLKMMIDFLPRDTFTEIQSAIDAALQACRPYVYLQRNVTLPDPPSSGDSNHYFWACIPAGTAIRFLSAQGRRWRLRHACFGEYNSLFMLQEGARLTLMNVELCPTRVWVTNARGVPIRGSAGRQQIRVATMASLSSSRVEIAEDVLAAGYSMLAGGWP